MSTRPNNRKAKLINKKENDSSKTNKEVIRCYCVHVVSGLKVVLSSPHLGVSAAGDVSGIGSLSKFSIDKMSLVPPASVENTQTGPLNPTIQLLDPLIMDVR